MGEKKSVYWSDDEDEGRERGRTMLQVALKDFLVFHETGNASAMTLENYGNTLSAFVGWLYSEGELVYVDQLRVKHLRG